MLSFSAWQGQSWSWTILTFQEKNGKHPIFQSSTSIIIVFFIFIIYLAAPGLSCITWDLLLMHVKTLSCSMWDLVPWTGIEPRSPALEAWSLSHWTTREVAKLVASEWVISYPSPWSQETRPVGTQRLSWYYELHNCQQGKICALESTGIKHFPQWIRIQLPMQGTRVWSLIREDPTCFRATKSVHHHYWACVPQLLKPMHLEPMPHNKRSHHSEKPEHYNKE